LELNPGSAPVPTNGFIVRTGIFLRECQGDFHQRQQKWIEDQERDFTEAQNKNPNLSIEDWLERYIFTDIHKIFLRGIHQDLYEWLSRLADT
jgi:hypothetical protein